MVKSLTLLFICFTQWPAFAIITSKNTQPSWSEWKAQIEKSYDGRFSAPSITHHIYLKKKGDSTSLKISRRKGGYPRFMSKACLDCPWQVRRTKDDSLEIFFKEMGQKKALPLEKETALNERYYLSAVHYKDKDEFRIFVHDIKLPGLDKKRKRHFFNYAKNHIYPSQFFWLKKPKQARIQRSDGSTKAMPIVAELKYNINGKSGVLSVYNYQVDSEDYKKNDVTMLLFRDFSNGKKTYGAGRFLNVYFPKKIGEMTDGETVNIDFNYAYNPPCAVSTGFHCPLPQNLVSLSVEAGEKYLSH